MRFSDFVEYVYLREQNKESWERAKEHEIMESSLRLVFLTASLSLDLSFGLRLGAINKENMQTHVSDSLYELGRLFLLANEGNILDDVALELSFSWNICPEWDDAKLLDTVVTANHIANKNLQNVSQGILQRTAFYPLFAVLAKVLKDKTLADVCEEYCSDRPMGQETRAEPADQEG
jgi:hypothetical protein